jgi:hypothetical protein
MICAKDCDLEELELDDLDGEVDKVQGLSLLEHIKLAKLSINPTPSSLQLVD